MSTFMINKMENRKWDKSIRQFMVHSLSIVLKYKEHIY